MKTNEQKWREVFSRLAETINEITEHRTNYGGCCVVAAEIGKALQAQGIPARVMVHRTGMGDIDEFRNNEPDVVGNWWSHFNFPHGEVAFEKDGKEWIFDTDDGLRELTTYYKHRKLCTGALTVEEALALASTPRHWNDWFPRETIPQIRRAIKRTLTPKKLEIAP